jgi:hypothetical protein
VPAGEAWDALPQGVRRAVGEVLAPAFQRLVVEAPDELERSAGITFVHLMWLEVCDQAAMSEIVGDRKAVYASVEEPEEAVARHLHLVAAKNSTGELLMKLRMVRETLEREERLMAIPGPVPALAAPPREEG